MCLRVVWPLEDAAAERKGEVGQDCPGWVLREEQQQRLGRLGAHPREQVNVKCGTGAGCSCAMEEWWPVPLSGVLPPPTR